MTVSKRPELPKAFADFVNKREEVAVEESDKKRPLKLILMESVYNEIKKQQSRSGIDVMNWIRAAIREKLDREESK